MRKISVAKKRRGNGKLFEQEKSIAIPNMIVL
jgi:hypothetical protein